MGLINHALLSFVYYLFAGLVLAAGGPVAVDLADVACRGEGFYFLVLHPSQDLAELIFVEEHLEFDGLLAGIAAGDLVEGAAAVEFLDDVFADALIVFGDDAEALVVVEGGGEVVDHEAVDPGADEADDDHAEGVDSEGGAADDGAGHRDGGTDVEVQVFVDNLGQDVESTSGSVDAEHQGLGGTEQQHEAAEVKPGVAHNGVVIDDTIVRRQDIFTSGILGIPREHPGPEVGEGTEDKGGEDRLETKLAVDEDEGEDEQDDVDDHDECAETEDVAHQLVEDDGEA